MRNIQEIALLSVDLLKYLKGRDYFHQPQPLGKYFDDPRCYYNDLRRKAVWPGAFIDGVPAVKVASSQEPLVFSMSVFLYGLGSLDRYFWDQDNAMLDNVACVSQWMIKNITVRGDFDNSWQRLMPHWSLYSDNSGMTQGLALSFAIRVVKYGLAEPAVCAQLNALIVRIKENMMRDVVSGGTFFENEQGVFFLEFPRKDGLVVFNGWIFAIFGLYDYIYFKDDPEVKKILERTVKTMENSLSTYYSSGGWGSYDNMSRKCSPFYQDLHIALLEAMHKITGTAVFDFYAKKAKCANTRWNRFKFSVVKIFEKLFVDKGMNIHA